MKIEGTASIIIGGADGVGKEVVLLILKKGGKVCLADIQDEKGQALVEELQQKYGKDKVFYQHCNVCKSEEIEGLFPKATEVFAQKPSILMSMAGMIDEFNWELCLDVNIGGTIRLVNAARKFMGKDSGGEGGCVVVMASISGVQPESWGPVYTASKHAVVGLIRSWAKEPNYSAHGIRFNAICPGSVRTAFLGQVANAYYLEENKARLNAVHLFEPCEIASGFIQFVEDDTLVGRALCFTRERGTQFFEFVPNVSA